MAAPAAGGRGCTRPVRRLSAALIESHASSAVGCRPFRAIPTTMKVIGMHVLTVVCHPQRASFTHAIATAFMEGAESAGNTTELLDLYASGFDPIMSERDMLQFESVPMPADVLAEQARIENADALCLVFPIWWYGMPAMMKGWLDRVWSAGWAYAWEYEPEGSLLQSRPCTLLMPMGATRRQLDRWGYEESLDHLWRYGIFGYCGVDPIRIALLEDSAEHDQASVARLRAHVDTARQAGEVIGCDPLAAPGIKSLLRSGSGIDVSSRSRPGMTAPR